MLLIKYCQEGWPNRNTLSSDLKPYHLVFTELSLQNGILMQIVDSWYHDLCNPDTAEITQWTPRHLKMLWTCKTLGLVAQHQQRLGSRGEEMYFLLQSPSTVCRTITSYIISTTSMAANWNWLAQVQWFKVCTGSRLLLSLHWTG